MTLTLALSALLFCFRPRPKTSSANSILARLVDLGMESSFIKSQRRAIIFGVLRSSESASARESAKRSSTYPEEGGSSSKKKRTTRLYALSAPSRDSHVKFIGER